MQQMKALLPRLAARGCAAAAEGVGRAARRPLSLECAATCLLSDVKTLLSSLASDGTRLYVGARLNV